MGQPADTPHPPDASAMLEGTRRGFFAHLVALAIGGIVTLFPFLAGALVLFDPVARRSAGGGKRVRVATLDALAADGVPRQFSVIANRDDAWTRFVDEPIGAVYLVRQAGTNQVQALNATCPHLGCMVAYLRQDGHFQCPCHESKFQVSGSHWGERIDLDTNPSPRDMDTLDCEVVDNPDLPGVKEIWVTYVDYLSGPSKKVAKI